jgi:predicted aldo/keto reductase-like oxidoreductase
VFHGGFDGILIRGTDYDQNKVNEMFDLAIKEGVNYFDLYCRAKEYGF